MNDAETTTYSEKIRKAQHIPAIKKDQLPLSN